MKRSTCAVLAAIFAAGCAAPPNTPGAGEGDRYTPIIDMQGVNESRYYNDLDGCRQYARTIDAGKASLTGAIVGALMGMSAGNRYNLGTRNTQSLMSDGAQSGSAGYGAAAQAKQRTVMINCMASRGYHTLDGGNVAYVQASPQQTPPLVTADVAPTADTVPRPVPPIAPAPPPAVAATPPAPATPTATAVVAVNTPAARPATLVATVTSTATVASGKFAWEAEHVARDAGCPTRVQSMLNAKVPGVETYTVACLNGDVMAVRCEFSNCRALQ